MISLAERIAQNNYRDNGELYCEEAIILAETLVSLEPFIKALQDVREGDIAVGGSNKIFYIHGALYSKKNIDKDLWDEAERLSKSSEVDCVEEWGLASSPIYEFVGDGAMADCGCPRMINNQPERWVAYDDLGRVDKTLTRSIVLMGLPPQVLPSNTHHFAAVQQWVRDYKTDRVNAPKEAFYRE